MRASLCSATSAILIIKFNTLYGSCVFMMFDGYGELENEHNDANAASVLALFQ